MSCWRCHAGRDPSKLTGALPLSGGQRFPHSSGTVIASNLTPHDNGLATWSDAQIDTLLRTGTRRDGTTARVMPWSTTAGLTAVDRAAIIGALRTLKPVP